MDLNVNVHSDPVSSFNTADLGEYPQPKSYNPGRVPWGIKYGREGQFDVDD